MQSVSFRWCFLPSEPSPYDAAWEEGIFLPQNGTNVWCRIQGLSLAQAKHIAWMYHSELGGYSHVIPRSATPETGACLVFLEYHPGRLQQLTDLLRGQPQPDMGTPQTGVLVPNSSQVARTDFRTDLHDFADVFAGRLQNWLLKMTTPPLPWNLRCGTLSFSPSFPRIMGILNVTPDSFSDGGHYHAPKQAVERGLQMIEQGAEILDIGGESTRPGSAPVSASEELSRIIPVLETLAIQTKIPLSVDTTKAEVARIALQSGADIINDISGMRFDAEMPSTIASQKGHVILMHSRHTPATMQQAPAYDCLWDELLQELEQGYAQLIQAGVPSSQIAVDPGIGFGKRLHDNYRIVRELPTLRQFHSPIVVGASRKSFLGAVLHRPVHERLEGSLAVAAISAWHQAHILRVHDVAETKRLLSVIQAIFWPPLPLAP